MELIYNAHNHRRLKDGSENIKNQRASGKKKDGEEGHEEKKEKEENDEEKKMKRMRQMKRTEKSREGTGWKRAPQPEGEE